jgi:hypothetical protein
MSAATNVCRYQKTFAAAWVPHESPPGGEFGLR